MRPGSNFGNYSVGVGARKWSFESAREELYFHQHLAVKSQKMIVQFCSTTN